MSKGKSEKAGYMAIISKAKGPSGNAAGKQVKGDRIDSRKEESKARAMDKRK
jgi:hypothetical protein